MGNLLENERSKALEFAASVRRLVDRANVASQLEDERLEAEEDDNGGHAEVLQAKLGELQRTFDDEYDRL